MTTITVRTYRIADFPFDEAAARERGIWSVFGEVGDIRPDPTTDGFVLTDVDVPSDQALRGATWRRTGCTILDPKDPA